MNSTIIVIGVLSGICGGLLGVHFKWNMAETVVAGMIIATAAGILVL